MAQKFLPVQRRIVSADRQADVARSINQLQADLVGGVNSGLASVTALQRTLATPGAWVPFGRGYLNSWTDNAAPYGPASYRVNAINEVWVRGSSNAPGGGSALSLFQFPVGVRPKVDVQATCAWYTGAAQSQMNMLVDTNGFLTPLATVTGGNVSFAFSFLAEQ